MAPELTRTGRLDSYDRKLLAALQEDGALGPVELSQRINLSASQCSRRLQRLRDRGLIARTVAILDRDAMNLTISAIILIRLGSHSAENEQRFLNCVEANPEITACHYVTGDLDFILHVVTKDLASYDRLVRERLLPSADIGACRSNIILRTTKTTTSLPLDFV
jgi:Lrp/AsnC family transcriptional regulator, leucine-responsive regulatory protein